MGELFRSEPMQMVQLFFQMEAAHDTVDELGELGVIQFTDLNPDVNLFQRNFVDELKRADEMERKLRFFESLVSKHDFGTELEAIQVEFGDVPLQVGRLQMDDMEVRFEELEKEFLDMNSNEEKMKRKCLDLIEMKHVLAKDAEFFAQAGSSEEDVIYNFENSINDDVEDPLLGGGGGASSSTSIGAQYPKAIKLGFVTGVIAKDKVVSFERILWRATRGNLFMKQAEIAEPIEDPHTGQLIEKNVFIIFFQGERAQEKIKKICESFGANLYPCPDSPKERRELSSRVESALEEVEEVIARSTEHRRRRLLDIATHLESWKIKVTKEKSIYHTMNLFNYDTGRKCLIAEGWCPMSATEDIHAALRRANERSGALVPSILNVVTPKEQPPTHFKTNKFTSSFQAIVDAYGMARYQEVNPGVFTIVTFPFLFGIMFGDVGHGLLLLFFSAYLVWKEKTLSKVKLNEMIQMCFDGRYLLLLMSICAIYAGLIYNECFAIPLDLFGSRWSYAQGATSATWDGSGIAYPFGVDPAWKGAKNELTFYNSFKMKLSLVFGIAQMLFGIFLSLLNGLHFKKPYNVYFEFIPQMCFMLSIFGYMTFLIFFKWSTDFGNTEAPLLLNLLIDMFLSPFNVKPLNHLYTGQTAVQVTLLIIAMISVPMMLLPKPLLLRRDAKRKYLMMAAHDSDLEGESIEVSGEEEEEFDFGEILVHQTIHTIEFVLGAISNTASYLRLWALSLAHSELATVFWDRILVLTFSQNNTPTVRPAHTAKPIKTAPALFCEKVNTRIRSQKTVASSEWAKLKAQRRR
ncbi:V-type proton ATPase subunit a [Balamuthia mandrillaris]